MNSLCLRPKIFRNLVKQVKKNNNNRNNKIIISKNHSKNFNAVAITRFIRTYSEEVKPNPKNDTVKSANDSSNINSNIGGEEKHKLTTSELFAEGEHDPITTKELYRAGAKVIVGRMSFMISLGTFIGGYFATRGFDWVTMLSSIGLPSGPYVVTFSTFLSAYLILLATKPIRDSLKDYLYDKTRKASAANLCVQMASSNRTYNELVQFARSYRVFERTGGFTRSETLKQEEEFIKVRIDDLRNQIHQFNLELDLIKSELQKSESENNNNSKETPASMTKRIKELDNMIANRTAKLNKVLKGEMKFQEKLQKIKDQAALVKIQMEEEEEKYRKYDDAAEAKLLKKDVVAEEEVEQADIKQEQEQQQQQQQEQNQDQNEIKSSEQQQEQQQGQQQQHQNETKATSEQKQQHTKEEGQQSRKE